MLTSAALLIQQPDGTVYEVPLQAEHVVFGRAPEWDIVVEGRLISRQHATISRSGATYTLEDLGSHNGTTVNGRRVRGLWMLHGGDIIELGGVGRLTFVDGDATSTRPQAPAVGVWLDRAAQDVW